MLVSYKGAQPQELPAEYSNYTVQELSALGITVVSEPPSVQSGQKADWNGSSWVVTTISGSELEIRKQWLKNEVHRLLQESDEEITMLNEKNVTIPSSMLEYRDALRAVPNTDTPFDVTWPEKPIIELTANDLVKAEAARRILEICPEWKQRNLTAQAAILAKKGEETWTPEEQAAWDAGEEIWTQIAIIRAKSDALEAMDPIPADFKDDSYWT